MEHSEVILGWIAFAALAMEIFAIAVIVAGLTYGAFRFVRVLLRRGKAEPEYTKFKAFIGRTLLLGLEIMVAADVVRTVALEPTLQSVTILGLLVLIRTFLSWSLVVEIEERWPWQKRRAAQEPEVE